VEKEPEDKSKIRMGRLGKKKEDVKSKETEQITHLIGKDDVFSLKIVGNFEKHGSNFNLKF